MQNRFVETCFLLVVLAAPAAFPDLAMSAPSFDCAKASTPAERLICAPGRDETLAAKDNALAAIYRIVLGGAGNSRATIVAAQSKWIRERDAACIQPGKSENQQADCLGEKYDERIRTLKQMRPGAQESLALCTALVDRYKTALQTASGKDHATMPGILDMLKEAPDGRLDIAPTTDLASAGNNELPTAEAYVRQHFNPDAALAQVLKQGSEDDGELAGSDAVWLTRLPKTDIYGLSTLNGTMRCEAISLLFKAQKTGASELDNPVDQSGCPANYFAAIGDQPALISSEYAGDVTPKTYHLLEGFSVYPWKDGWQPACNISLTYAPKMSYPGRPDPSGSDAEDGESCAPGDKACVDLREAVLAVMIRYQQDPERGPAALLKELSATQRRDFLKMKAASDAQASSDDENASETGNYPSLALDVSGNDAIALSTNPVALPLVRNGKVMLVLAGHQMTSGSRDLPDYDVWVKEMNGAKVTAVSTFPISLSFGALQTVKVSLP